MGNIIERNFFLKQAIMKINQRKNGLDILKILMFIYIEIMFLKAYKQNFLAKTFFSIKFFNWKCDFYFENIYVLRPC